MTIARKGLEGNAAANKSSAKTGASESDGDVWGNITVNESSRRGLTEARGEPGSVVDIEGVRRNEVA
jgi:hypothetical protein